MDPGSESTATDSAAVVRVAADTLAAVIPGVVLRVARFDRTGGGFIVELIAADPLSTGGGGVVGMTRDRKVTSVVMSQ
ncbi:MAG TPA: hypothetical protein VF625_13830 [Longimicrobium sp.]